MMMETTKCHRVVMSHRVVRVRIRLVRMKSHKLVLVRSRLMVKTHLTVKTHRLVMVRSLLRMMLKPRPVVTLIRRQVETIQINHPAKTKQSHQLAMIRLRLTAMVKVKINQPQRQRISMTRLEATKTLPRATIKTR
jgi:hypothetical protein